MKLKCIMHVLHNSSCFFQLRFLLFWMMSTKNLAIRPKNKFFIAMFCAYDCLIPQCRAGFEKFYNILLNFLNNEFTLK
ncbi:hypothetical protein C5602_06360 [Klebsiella pneumoniae]|nr:hypothetical protein [Klebsiella pneumoniae]